MPRTIRATRRHVWQKMVSSFPTDLALAITRPGELDAGFTEVCNFSEKVGAPAYGEYRQTRRRRSPCLRG